MRYYLLIITLIISFQSISQQTDIVDLINQIAQQEVPDNYKFYFLLQESLENQKNNYRLQNHQKRALLNADSNFPFDLVDLRDDEVLDWGNFDIKKVKYIPKELHRSSPKTMKDVYFVSYHIKQTEMDRLLINRKPHTLYVKKKWLWTKKRVWKEVVKVWKEDEKQHLEEQSYFGFSKPIFSSDKRYARISIFKNNRCKSRGRTIIYKNTNRIWKKVIEYNQVQSMVSMSHVSCGDVLVSYQN